MSEGVITTFSLLFQLFYLSHIETESVLEVLHTVLGARRKGRADELFPIAVGGVVPGVGLDDELLPSEAQTTPAEQESVSGKMAVTERGRNCGYTHCFPGRVM